MSDLAKILVILGIALVLAGLATWGLGRAGFRGLPGDIHFESDGTHVHIPLVTMVVASIVLTILVNVVLWIWRALGK